MYLTSLIRTQGNHKPPKEILVRSLDWQVQISPGCGEPQRTQHHHNECSSHPVSLQGCIPPPHQPPACWRGLSALADAVPGPTFNFRTEKNTEQLTSSSPIHRHLPTQAQLSRLVSSSPLWPARGRCDTGEVTRIWLHDFIKYLHRN